MIKIFGIVSTFWKLTRKDIKNELKTALALSNQGCFF